MGQNDEKTPRGFLYRWANDPRVETKTPTIKMIPCEALVQAEEEEDQIPCEVYSRIVGYLRPVRNWNTGKKQEFAERQVYNLPEVVE